MNVVPDPGVVLLSEPGVVLLSEPGVVLLSEPGVNVVPEPGVVLLSEPPRSSIMPPSMLCFLKISGSYLWSRAQSTSALIILTGSGAAPPAGTGFRGSIALQFRITSKPSITRPNAVNRLSS